MIRRGYDLSRCLALHFFHEAVLEVTLDLNILSLHCKSGRRVLTRITYRIMEEVPQKKVILPTINFIVIHLADILQEQQEKEDMIRRPVPNSPISWVDDRK